MRSNNEVPQKPKPGMPSPAHMPQRRKPRFAENGMRIAYVSGEAKPTGETDLAQKQRAAVRNLIKPTVVTHEEVVPVSHEEPEGLRNPIGDIEYVDTKQHRRLTKKALARAAELDYDHIEDDDLGDFADRNIHEDLHR